eukprot:UN27910
MYGSHHPAKSGVSFASYAGSRHPFEGTQASGLQFTQPKPQFHSARSLNFAARPTYAARPQPIPHTHSVPGKRPTRNIVQRRHLRSGLEMQNTASKAVRHPQFIADPNSRPAHVLLNQQGKTYSQKLLHPNALSNAASIGAAVRHQKQKEI